jgi:hypothetical protein
LVGIDTTIDDRTQRIGYGVCQVSSTLLAHRHHIARLMPQDSSPETAFTGRTESAAPLGLSKDKALGDGIPAVVEDPPEVAANKEEMRERAERS